MSHLALFLLAFAIGAQDQERIRVWAEISADSIAVGDVAILKLHVETGGAAPESIELPSLPDGLDVVGTQDYSQFHFSIPGGRSRVLRREIILRARNPGRFRIPPISVRVRGTHYRTDPVTLAVGGTSHGPGGSGVGGGGLRVGQGASGPGDEVILDLTASADTIFVNQQLTLRADLLISEEAQFRLRRAPEYIPPNAAGFWVHEFPTPTRGGRRTIQGQTYHAQSFHRAFFPLAPGRYAFDPAKLTYEVRRGYLYSPDRQELVTDSVRVVVVPLPDEGRPASFTGAVGRFDIRARVEPADVPAGEATMLVIEIEGEGNIKSLPPPQLPEMQGVQVYPPSETAELAPRGTAVAGVKRFTWVLIPDRAGKIELPGTEYAYFDPARRAYEVVRTPPLTLEVRPGAGMPAPAEPTAIRSIKPAPKESPIHWVRSPLFLVLQAVPLAALLLVVLLRRRRSRPRTAPIRVLRRKRREAWAKLRERAAGSDPTFFDALALMIRTGIADRLGREELERASKEVIIGALQEQRVSSTVTRAIGRLLDRVSHARYEPTPPGPDARGKLVDEAEQLLDAVDREARAPARGQVTATIALTLVLAVAGSGSAMADPGRFERASELYRNGEFDEAATEFAEFVRSRPRDAHGWYNLGNAHFMAGRRGPATWAWLHALRLSPRDADLRHNLNVAGIDARLLRRAGPTLPLSDEEMLLIASVVWFLAAGGIGIYLGKGRKAGGIAGALGIVAAIATAAGVIGLNTPRTIGVTLPDPTTLRAGPGIRAEPILELPGGTGLRIIERRNGWMRIETLDGTQGWVEEIEAGVF